MIYRHYLIRFLEQLCEVDVNLILQMVSSRLRDVQYLDHSKATRKRFRNPPAEGSTGPTVNRRG